MIYLMNQLPRKLTGTISKFQPDWHLIYTIGLIDCRRLWRIEHSTQQSHIKQDFKCYKY